MRCAPTPVARLAARWRRHAWLRRRKYRAHSCQISAKEWRKNRRTRNQKIRKKSWRLVILAAYTSSKARSASAKAKKRRHGLKAAEREEQYRTTVMAMAKKRTSGGLNLAKITACWLRQKARGRNGSGLEEDQQRQRRNRRKRGVAHHLSESSRRAKSENSGAAEENAGEALKCIGSMKAASAQRRAWKINEKRRRKSGMRLKRRHLLAGSRHRRRRRRKKMFILDGEKRWQRGETSERRAENGESESVRKKMKTKRKAKS